LFDVITSISNKKEMLITAANYLTVDIPGLLQKENTILPTPEALTELFTMTDENVLSSRGTKDILAMLVNGALGSPKILAEQNGLIQKNNPEALRAIVCDAVTANPKQVEEWKSGKESILMFFVGQCMKASKGSGNPGLFQELLKEELGK